MTCLKRNRTQKHKTEEKTSISHKCYLEYESKCKTQTYTLSTKKCTQLKSYLIEYMKLKHKHHLLKNAHN